MMKLLLIGVAVAAGGRKYNRPRRHNAGAMVAGLQ